MSIGKSNQVPLEPVQRILSQHQPVTQALQQNPAFDRITPPWLDLIVQTRPGFLFSRGIQAVYDFDKGSLSGTAVAEARRKSIKQSATVQDFSRQPCHRFLWELVENQQERRHFHCSSCWRGSPACGEMAAGMVITPLPKQPSEFPGC